MFVSGDLVKIRTAAIDDPDWNKYWDQSSSGLTVPPTGYIKPSLLGNEGHWDECPTCNGSAIDPTKKLQCDICKGTGYDPRGWNAINDKINPRRREILEKERSHPPVCPGCYGDGTKPVSCPNCEDGYVYVGPERENWVPGQAKNQPQIPEFQFDPKQRELEEMEKHAEQHFHPEALQETFGTAPGTEPGQMSPWPETNEEGYGPDQEDWEGVRRNLMDKEWFERLHHFQDAINNPYNYKQWNPGEQQYNEREAMFIPRKLVDERVSALENLYQNQIGQHSGPERRQMDTDLDAAWASKNQERRSPVCQACGTGQMVGGVCNQCGQQQQPEFGQGFGQWPRQGTKESWRYEHDKEMKNQFEDNPGQIHIPPILHGYLQENLVHSNRPIGKIPGRVDLEGFSSHMHPNAHQHYQNEIEQFINEDPQAVKTYGEHYNFPSLGQMFYRWRSPEWPHREDPDEFHRGLRERAEAFGPVRPLVWNPQTEMLEHQEYQDPDTGQSDMTIPEDWSRQGAQVLGPHTEGYDEDLRCPHCGTPIDHDIATGQVYCPGCNQSWNVGHDEPPETGDINLHMKRMNLGIDPKYGAETYIPPTPPPPPGSNPPAQVYKGISVGEGQQAPQAAGGEQVYNPGQLNTILENVHPAVRQHIQNEIMQGAKPGEALQKAQELETNVQQSESQGDLMKNLQVFTKFVSSDLVKERISNLG